MTHSIAIWPMTLIAATCGALATLASAIFLFTLAVLTPFIPNAEKAEDMVSELPSAHGLLENLAKNPHWPQLPETKLQID
jgi:hypothetical protein